MLKSLLKIEISQTIEINWIIERTKEKYFEINVTCLFCELKHGNFIARKLDSRKSLERHSQLITLIRCGPLRSAYSYSYRRYCLTRNFSLGAPWFIARTQIISRRSFRFACHAPRRFVCSSLRRISRAALLLSPIVSLNTRSISNRVAQ